MLFSDIEGSTRLLSRVGDAYLEVLDRHRSVLRQAWTRWRGHEMGTEGDSFFVVFEVAGDAVSAALEAQRGLATQQWPGGQRLRVRMGVHTGEPLLRDGDYVGMDVHRAARLAGAAHGGQVVVSSATAELVRLRLPDGAALVDLGWHKLKDLADATHVFQLSGLGLGDRFPPLKSVGAATSLPRPETGLVGRSGDLVELAAVFGSPDVRLLTLTGPGGSGKTRLAIALARHVAGEFPDGVFFVPLASVVQVEAMWGSVAEVVDAPTQARSPDGLSRHLAHRATVLVLDNLEQLPGADRVASELLAGAPKLHIIATSRRPLHVAGEHEFPVPPLAWPEEKSLPQARASSAVQLFIQQAMMVRPTFALTVENAADICELCSKLDGLPLGIEIAAARTKLLSVAALLKRLDAALDFTDLRLDRPRRQRTLRDTIAWSYDLLDPALQRFFSRLGVFAGGADLDGVAAVTGGADGSDPLDSVAELVDASLVTVTEDSHGEPRVCLLETVRAFALDQLRVSDQLEIVRAAHAEHYLLVVRDVRSAERGGGDRVLSGRHRFASEIDNVRAALAWALRPTDGVPPAPTQVRVGLSLCAELDLLWREGGFVAEGRQWLELAIAASGDVDSPALAACLSGLSWLSRVVGDFDRAQSAAARAVAIRRRLDNHHQLSSALTYLGDLELLMDDPAAARRSLQEAVTLAGDTDDARLLSDALSHLAALESMEGNWERSLNTYETSLNLDVAQGNETGALANRHGMACTLRQMGRLDEALTQWRELIPHLLRLASPSHLIAVAEDYAALLADVGAHPSVPRLIGAADATRTRRGEPRPPAQQREIRQALANAQAAMPTQTWDHEYVIGHGMTVVAVLESTQPARWHRQPEP
jgi:predicted ATPase/class 3 adenylate cyclase